jgi:hypothetical protein
MSGVIGVTLGGGGERDKHPLQYFFLPKNIFRLATEFEGEKMGWDGWKGVCVY